MANPADETPDERLSRIVTMWTMVRAAHGERDRESKAALEHLVERYRGAAYVYLLGAVRDRESADELFQEFALRVLRGDFGRARPERGRFRDYLRRVLINLVNDLHRARQAQPGRLEHEVAAPAVATPQEDEASFLAAWRSELLERTWRALAEAQPTYFAVLIDRIQNPDATSSEMAERLSAQLGRVMNADLVRKSLQRAQKRFAELLVEEVRGSLDQPAQEELVFELRELDLLRYCQTAMDRQAS